ncbi:MAG: hypothetical protein ACYC6L_08185, partial [Anaerolineae bacterium]
MRKLLGFAFPLTRLGLAQVRHQLLQWVLIGFGIVIALGVILWSILGGLLSNLPVMQQRFWFLGLGSLLGFGVAYLLAAKWRYEAGAALLLFLIIGILFLVDYPDKITRGRGLLLAAVPIVL